MSIWRPERENRFCLPNTRFLIHQPAGRLRGDASDIEIHAGKSSRPRERINKIIAERTGQSLSQGGGGHGPGLLDERRGIPGVRPSRQDHQVGGRVGLAVNKTLEKRPSCWNPTGFGVKCAGS